MLSPDTRFVALEMKATAWPSVLMEGAELLPFAGEAPEPWGWLASAVRGVQPVVVVARLRQVLRTKMFSTPFWVFDPRFVACEAKATISPEVQAVVVVVIVEQVLILGLSLKALPGVEGVAVVSGDDTSTVAAEHVMPEIAVAPLHVSRR